MVKAVRLPVHVIASGQSKAPTWNTECQRYVLKATEGQRCLEYGNIWWLREVVNGRTWKEVNKQIALYMGRFGIRKSHPYAMINKAFPDYFYCF